MTSPEENLMRESPLGGLVAEAAERARAEVFKDGQLDPQVIEALDMLVKNVVAVAEQGSDFETVESSIRRREEDVKKGVAVFGVMLKQIEAIKAERAVQTHDEAWWVRRIESLVQAFEGGLEEGMRLWLQIYAEALVEWELTICNELVSNLPPELVAQSEVLTLFQEGTSTIIDWNYGPRTTEMVEYLLKNVPLATAPHENGLDKTGRMILHIYLGLIYLYLARPSVVGPGPENAVKNFEEAKSLAPQDGRPRAALGYFNYCKGDREKARELYQEAISLSPQQPEGYIGMGMFFEDESLWDEADDWYEQAIATVEGSPNIIGSLTRHLAPLPGNLYLHLARKLKQDDPERALLTVTLALSIGIRDQGEYPERLGYKLKGEILEQLGKQSEAAEAYYDAGRRYGWQNEAATATELLRKAHSLNPEHAPTLWELSDIVRVNSSTTQPPYVNQELIAESLNFWEKGIGIKTPEAADSWVYVSRGLINEQLARIPGADRRTLNWEAISYIERALLMYNEEAFRWACLGRIYSRLDAPSNVIRYCEKALSLDSGSVIALEDLSVVYANIGEFERAIELIDKRLEIDRTPWPEALKAYALLHIGKYEEAVKLLDHAIETSPNDVWYYEVSGLCYQLMGDRENSRRRYQTIFERYDPLDMDNLGAYAWAAYSIGQTEKATELLNRLLEEMPDAEGNTRRNLGLCYLRRGDLERAKTNMTAGINLARNVRELDDFTLIDFKEVEEASLAWPHGEEARRLLAEMRSLADAKRQEVEQLPTPEEELKILVPDTELESGRGGWVWIGYHAGLARLHAEHERWAEAASVYEKLLEVPDKFPEARAGMEKALASIPLKGAVDSGTS